MERLLTVENLCISFDVDGKRLQAVDNVSFHVDKGEIVGLVGESGCGKSVTSMSILRLIPQPPGKIEKGKILLEDVSLLELPLPELRKVRGKDVGVIFQEPMTALSPLHRIGNQLCEAQRLHDPDLSKAEAWAYGEEWLAKVGIPDPEERMFAYPYQFSGGMRQRAMIASVLLMHPKLIIADEPTTALDVTIQAQVFDLMTRMKADETSVLLITHDMGVIWEMCDRVIVMYASQIVEEAPVEELFDNPLHPYTQGLMKAVPRVNMQHEERLSTIKGKVPSPLEYPVGCNFCDRCPRAFDRCIKEEPQLIQFNESRRVRCFAVEEDMKKKGKDAAPQAPNEEES